MLKIYAKFDVKGHVLEYRVGEPIDAAEAFEVEDFDHEKFRFYKQVDGALVFDEARYQDWLNPVEPSTPAPAPSIEEQLNAALLKIDVLNARQMALQDDLIFVIESLGG